MPGPEDAKRPYAAPSNVVGVIQRARTRNLPDKIDNDFLRLAGVPEVVFGRVASALRFLDLTTDDDKPTDTMKALAAATDDEYADILAGTIRAAYADDFDRIDPGKDGQAQIISAFKRYQPRSQSARMVMLFLALCREAGIPVKDAPRERNMQASGKKKVAARPPGIRADRAGAHVLHQRLGAPTNDGGQLFGVYEADIALLDEDEFNAVWNALGKVARARAARSSQPTAAMTSDDSNVIDEDESEDS